MLSPACLPVFKQVRKGDSSSVDVRLNADSYCVKALIACKVFAVAGWCRRCESGLKVEAAHSAETSERTNHEK